MSSLSLSLLHRPDAGWRFSLYPDAEEGGGSFQLSLRRVPTYLSRGYALDPERSASEAGRRARAKLRRYCTANRLNRLGILTFAGDGCHEPAELRGLLSAFFRALRVALGGAVFAYVWVPEWHPKRGGQLGICRSMWPSRFLSPVRGFWDCTGMTSCRASSRSPWR